MKLKLNVHETKVFGWIYPLFAKEFMFSKRYETFAEEVQKYFELTESQWEELLDEWELKEGSLVKEVSTKNVPLLTKELENFLRENGVLEKFIDNVDESCMSQTIKEIDLPFIWGFTEEGCEFWHKLHVQFEKIKI